MTKKMPTSDNIPVKMTPALDVLIDVHARPDTPDEYRGNTAFYFDEKRSLSYRSRWTLKTKAGAESRQKRETIQYLKDLRSQIDEVLAEIELTSFDEESHIQVWASVYDKEGQS